MNTHTYTYIIHFIPIVKLSIIITGRIHDHKLNLIFFLKYLLYYTRNFLTQHIIDTFPTLEMIYHRSYSCTVCARLLLYWC